MLQDKEEDSVYNWLGVEIESGWTCPIATESLIPTDGTITRQYISFEDSQIKILIRYCQISIFHQGRILDAEVIQSKLIAFSLSLSLSLSALSSHSLVVLLPVPSLPPSFYILRSLSHLTPLCLSSLSVVFLPQLHVSLAPFLNEVYHLPIVHLKVSFCCSLFFVSGLATDEVAHIPADRQTNKQTGRQICAPAFSQNHTLACSRNLPLRILTTLSSICISSSPVESGNKVISARMDTSRDNQIPATTTPATIHICFSYQSTSCDGFNNGNISLDLSRTKFSLTISFWVFFPPRCKCSSPDSVTLMFFLFNFMFCFPKWFPFHTSFCHKNAFSIWSCQSFYLHFC